MAITMTLSGYIALLKRVPAVVAPPSEKHWKEHVECICVPGRLAEVTEDDYYYWLEVLPPKWMSGSHFCFGEGYDPFRLLWKDRDSRYWARQLTEAETDTFCRLAGMLRST